MKKRGFCLAGKIGVSLLAASVVVLPIHPSLILGAETPVAGPSTERDSGVRSGDAGTGSVEPPVTGPSRERENGARAGDAGPGATKDLKKYKWWWIGGGLVAVAAVIAAAGGGGGGGGGGGFIPPPQH